MGLTRLEQYIDALPDGLGSYPDCTTKSVVSRSFYEGFGSPTLSNHVPAVLRELANDPPPVSVFVPEVHARALYLAIGDELGMSDEQLVVRSRKVNQDLISGPLYRVLFAFVSPERLFRGCGPRWQNFHRGTSVEPLEMTTRTCRLVTTSPPYVSDRLLMRMHATSFEVALIAAGGKNARCEVTQATPTTAYCDLSWDR